MRIAIQRVAEAKLEVEGNTLAEIKEGIIFLLDFMMEIMKAL